MDKAYLEALVQTFGEENGVAVRLSLEMPHDYETANGTYDDHTVFLNGVLLQDAPEHAVLFYLYHELRHAMQYLHPERCSAAVRESLPYVVLYDGTCCRLDEDGERECRLDGGTEQFIDAYLGLPYEEDANDYAYARACALCGETEELRQLRDYWRPRRAWTAEEYRRLFRRIDEAAAEQAEGKRRCYSRMIQEVSHERELESFDAQRQPACKRQHRRRAAGDGGGLPRKRRGG